MHLYVCRAFARVQEGDLHLKAAIDFLKAPGRIEEAKYPDRPGDLSKAVVLFDEGSADPRLDRLKHMRDKLIAHLARYELSNARPSYDDLFEFTRRTARIWEKLAHGRSIIIDLDQEVSVHRESAEAFWSRWEADARCPTAALSPLPCPSGANCGANEKARPRFRSRAVFCRTRRGRRTKKWDDGPTSREFCHSGFNLTLFGRVNRSGELQRSLVLARWRSR